MGRARQDKQKTNRRQAEDKQKTVKDGDLRGSEVSSWEQLTIAFLAILLFVMLYKIVNTNVLFL